MKLRTQILTQSPTSDIYKEWKHPWYEYQENGCIRRSDQAVPYLKRPNPPPAEAVKRAQFVDKTYEWKPNNRTT